MMKCNQMSTKNNNIFTNSIYGSCTSTRETSFKRGINNKQNKISEISTESQMPTVPSTQGQNLKSV